MFLRNVQKGAAAVTLGILAGLFFAVAPAQAASGCDITVVDGAGILGDGTTQVEEASQKLESVGADVRIRTLQSFAPAATLDAYIQSQETNCASWQSPDGSRKSNLVVFAMSMDERSVGIFYGSKWNNAFSGSNSETRIYQDFMTPQFQGGDFSQGFVDGIESHDLGRRRF